MKTRILHTITILTTAGISYGIGSLRQQGELSKLRHKNVDLQEQVVDVDSLLQVIASSQILAESYDRELEAKELLIDAQRRQVEAMGSLIHTQDELLERGFVLPAGSSLPSPEQAVAEESQ